MYIAEISPSEKYFKIQFVRCDNTTYTDWVEADDYELLEVLGSKMAQISDMVEEFYKKQQEDQRKSEDEYRQYSPLQNEVKKNKWVHGICNPPADDAKEYIKDGLKTTGKNYYSVKDMIEDLCDESYKGGYDGVASAYPEKYSKWLNEKKKEKI